MDQNDDDKIATNVIRSRKKLKSKKVKDQQARLTHLNLIKAAEKLCLFKHVLFLLLVKVQMNISAKTIPRGRGGTKRN